MSHPDWPGLDFVVLSLTLDASDEWTVAVTDRRGGGFWLFPLEKLTPEHFSHQEALARWMGTSVDVMNSEHDETHERLARWLEIPSYSLSVASGVSLSLEDHYLAALEEEVVLHLQRYLYHVIK